MQTEMGPHLQVDAPPVVDQIQPLFVQLELRDDAAAPMNASTLAPMAPSPSPPAPAPAGLEPAVLPTQGVLSGSPGIARPLGGGAAARGGASYPMCQVDDCRADLTRVKAYYRRHRVCQTHSKAFQTLVAGQMRRFCQMCSRFHRLAEFDDKKRSCRRRLAGHIPRRIRPGFPAVIARMDGNP